MIAPRGNITLACTYTHTYTKSRSNRLNTNTVGDTDNGHFAAAETGKKTNTSFEISNAIFKSVGKLSTPQVLRITIFQSHSRPIRQTPFLNILDGLY